MILAQKLEWHFSPDFLGGFSDSVGDWVLGIYSFYFILPVSVTQFLMIFT